MKKSATSAIKISAILSTGFDGNLTILNSGWPSKRLPSLAVGPAYRRLTFWNTILTEKTAFYWLKNWPILRCLPTTWAPTSSRSRLITMPVTTLNAMAAAPTPSS